MVSVNSSLSLRKWPLSVQNLCGTLAGIGIPLAVVFKAKTGPLHLTPSYQPWSGNPEVSLGPTRLTLPALFSPTFPLELPYNPRAPLGPHSFGDPIPQLFPVDKTLLLELWFFFFFLTVLPLGNPWYQEPSFLWFRQAKP